jgi:HlyD family type I secretion membrane fusion protein
MSTALTPYRPPGLPDRSGRREQLDERFADFLPDAQAVVESEASPVVRSLLVLLCLLVAGLIAFVSLVQVDQVATAQGVVRPTGQVKLVNHPLGGRVTAIYVRDGDTVAEGDPLVVLDPEVTEEEVAKLADELLGFEAQLARLEAEATGVDPVFPSDLQSQRPDLVTAQLNLYNARAEALQARLASAREVVNQRQESVGALEARVAQLRESLAILSEQEQAIGELADKGYFPRIRYLSVQRQLAEAEGELNQNRSNLAGARAALTEARSNLDRVTREWQADVLNEMTRTMSQRDRTARTLEQQRANLRNLTVTAPAAGVVQELAINNLGQAVSPGQEMMKIVPVGDSLVVETKVRNSDIGYVYEGQPATVKVDTFDFIRYGTLEGTVERISPDATRDERTGELFFEVAVRTDATQLADGSLVRQVVPGMTTTVDLRIGERTILAFLTDRIRTTTSAAFTER